MALILYWNARIPARLRTTHYGVDGAKDNKEFSLHMPYGLIYSMEQRICAIGVGVSLPYCPSLIWKDDTQTEYDSKYGEYHN